METLEQVPKYLSVYQIVPMINLLNLNKQSNYSVHYLLMMQSLILKVVIISKCVQIHIEFM